MLGLDNPIHLLFLLVLLLVVFGAKRLPEMGAAVGKGIREFKKSLRDVQDSIDQGGQTASLPPGQETRSMEQPVGSLPGYGHVEVPLGREVVEQESPRDPRRLGNLVDGHTVGTLRAQHVQAQLDELAAAFLGVEPGRPCARCHTPILVEHRSIVG